MKSEAAALLGVDQPKISALIRGKLSGFSTERLFRFLNALGCEAALKTGFPSLFTAEPEG
ncbi:helix-turn-helix domain-containing protein [Nostoc sp. CHAB 5784]|nr:helix-turn-helix domain-containing protein [Nostoc mirabile CHAB5784]